MSPQKTTHVNIAFFAALAAIALVGIAALPAQASPVPAQLSSGPAASASSVTAPAQPSSSGLDQHLAAAAYITPTNASWDRLIATGSRLGFVVVNVYNGPGTARNADFASVIDRAHAAGIRVLGYVDTGYLGGSNPVRYTRAGDTDATDWMVQAEQDVNDWYAFYGNPIDGIFFDDVMNTCGPTASSKAYAQDYRYLSAVVHSAHTGSLTVLNPGISVPQCYEDAGDVLLTFEGSAADYLNMPADLAPLPWQVKADPDKFWNIVYGADISQLTAVMNASKKNNVGYIYATDDTLPNPYDTVPGDAYWASEAADAAGAAGAAPTAVQDVAAVGTSPTAVTVGWLESGSRDIAGYDVYVGDRRVATVGRDQGDHGLFSTNITGLQSSTSLSLDVRARSLSGAVSVASRTAHARTWPAWGPKPTVPGSVTISDVAAGSAKLSWAASQALGGIAGYDVYQNGVMALTLPATVSSVRVGGLALGSDVSFTVLARGGNGRSSAMSAVVTASIPSPDPITDPSVTFGAETTDLQARYNVGFSFDHVFIDSDSSVSTGYQFGGIGAEYMIENGILYKDADDSNSWNWQPVTLSTGPLVSTAGGLHHWQVPSTLFGSSSAITVVFSGSGGYPDYTLAPIVAERSPSVAG